MVGQSLINTGKDAIHPWLIEIGEDLAPCITFHRPLTQQCNGCGFSLVGVNSNKFPIAPMQVIFTHYNLHAFPDYSLKQKGW